MIVKFKNIRNISTESNNSICKKYFKYKIIHVKQVFLYLDLLQYISADKVIVYDL